MLNEPPSPRPVPPINMKSYALQHCSIPYSKWDRNAGKVKAEHEFFFFPKSSSGFIVGKGFKSMKEIIQKVKFDCTIRFVNLKDEDSDNDLCGCLLIEANSSEALKKASLLLHERIQYGISMVDTNTSAEVMNEKASSSTSSSSLAPPSAKRSSSVPPAKRNSSASTAKQNSVVSTTKQNSVVSTAKQSIVASPPKLLQAAERRHVFVDNSTIFIGANRRGGSTNNAHFDIHKLTALLVANLPGTKFVAGSKPPITSGVWKIWKADGFQVEVTTRGYDCDSEDNVPRVLYNQIMETIATSRRNRDIRGANTLVLATEDVSGSGRWTTFTDCIVEALNSGWRVELWSWKRYFSHDLMNLCIHDNIKMLYFDDEDIDLEFKKPAAALKSFPVAEGTKQENAEMGTTAVKPPQAVVSKKEEKSNKESNDCVICMDRKSEYAIVPCGHKCLCSECQALPSITTCPICRGPKAFMLKIY
eukprot:CAMPEP_0170091608 /NCGR_PEP_ID=MMETSP0019_2-20121128/25174_1 /TAXON_ID=98059 /ORGANISM="Dinobryon sp., Strain UTEXLB2267" /LENGTH=473 /DNA_ID=CAMNT_0010311605 /DNA_START=20 /DNA_END=1441 /DNA_ORIENTATION=-